MRTIILIILCIVSIGGFSQENISTKTDSLKNPWKFNFDIRSNQFLITISKPLFGFHNDFETRISIRLERIEIYEGYLIRLDKHINLIPSIGFEYRYEQHEINPRVRASLRGDYDIFSFVIHYGSDWETNGVNTRFVYNIIGNRLQLGIETFDENIGPRMNVRVNVGTHRLKLLKLYGSYVGREFRYGVQIDFEQWFPKIHNKINKIGDGVNFF